MIMTYDFALIAQRNSELMKAINDARNNFLADWNKDGRATQQILEGICNILNNIPMTLAYGSILSNTENIKLVYATIIGSNIGALLTPVGALAGIMWLRILKANNVDYSFKAFLKNGLLITGFAIIAGIIGILII